MTKPRVMQLVLSLTPGGTERLVIDLCRRLADRVDTVVCCLDEPGEWAAEIAELNIPVVSLSRQPGFHPSLAVRLGEALKTYDIDVIHCHHYTPYVYGVMAAMLNPSVRVVFTEHGRLHGVGISTKRRLVNPVLSRWPARIFSVSAALKQDMVAEGFPGRSIDVLYNGIALGRRPLASERSAMREAMGVPSDALVIGTVGRLDPVKNLGTLLEARSILGARFPSVHVVVAGNGPERQALEERAVALGVAGVTHFTGYRTDVRDLMAAFGVYVNCSTYEGVSLTILEAMATTLPVVAGNVGGNPEVVIDQETGFLVGPRPSEFASAIGVLLSSPAKRQTMGDAGRWRVKRHFTIERMVDDYAAAYQLSRARRTTNATAAPAHTPADCDKNPATPIG